ncbi:MAG: hypothetical protein IJS01_08020 [Lentisphaeria bacterium]|nr:hypothetical protein [Lentisphaeria bacterium]
MAGAIEDIRPDYSEPNYDKAKIAPYVLEDPLTFADGRRVTSPEEWKRRRREILDIFAREMYGAEPPPPETLLIDKFEEKEDALAGFAVRSQYRMRFFPDGKGGEIQWLLLRPRHAKAPVPVILLLNYRGNHELIPDGEIPVPEMWTHGTPDHRIAVKRGVMCDPNSSSSMPIGMLLAAGYAVLTACYCQVSPDPLRTEPDPRYRQDPFAYTGVFELWGERDPARTDGITALGAWAWALSRGLDLAEKIPELDHARCIVTGCSRLGKAALLAAARDERFAVCVANQCGGGGATLAKRDYGENIATEMRAFSHWYCKAYEKYERNPARLLTFDQHLLLAAVAPRRLLIAGFDEPWFDTEGEYLACKAASCAWEFFGLPGLPRVPFPEDFDTSAVGTYLGYYRRSQGHGIAPFDWRQLLEFCGRKSR